MKRLISIIIPVKNEEENIPIICKKLEGTFKSLSYDYEIIFVNDGSSDCTKEIIEKWIARNQKIRYLELSRHFGKEMATTAGIYYAKGDAVIMIDGDLQHPPEYIPKFITKWEKGSNMVIGIRKKYSGAGFLKVLFSKMFYAMINTIGDTKITQGATDYRLLDKKIVKEFQRFTERNRMTRGLLDWLGFKKDYVYFDSNMRRNGDSKIDFSRRLTLGIDTLITHSMFPLKFAGYLGVSIMIISAPLGIFIFTEKYIFHDPWHLNFSGPAILAVIILFLIGIVLFCLGLIALYIGNIHSEMLNRPLFVIAEKKNFGNDENT